jgi:hypothetical protein
MSSLEVQIFMLIFGTLLLMFFTGRLLNFLELKSSKSENIWDDAIAFSLKKPLKIVIFVVGFSYAIELIAHKYTLLVLKEIDEIRNVLVIFSVLIFVLRSNS